jgi:hypothetical protein
LSSFILPGQFIFGHTFNRGRETWHPFWKLWAATARRFLKFVMRLMAQKYDQDTWAGIFILTGII